MGRSDCDPDELGLVGDDVHILHDLRRTPELRTIYLWPGTRQFRDFVRPSHKGDAHIPFALSGPVVFACTLFETIVPAIQALTMILWLVNQPWFFILLISIRMVAPLGQTGVSQTPVEERSQVLPVDEEGNPLPPPAYGTPPNNNLPNSH